MARAIELPRFSGIRSLGRLHADENRRSEQWMAVRSLDTPSWLKEVFDELNGLEALELNWDSYGAVAVGPAAIRCSKLLLSNAYLERFPKPQVSAVATGGVGLHWRVAERDLEVEIDTTGNIFFLKTHLSHPASNDEGEISSPKDAQETLDWLIAS